jgi:hypothetical protein
MPFELGVDVGCRLFKGGKWANKKCLILETERYRYQAAISDLSGSDIAVHNDEPREVATVVRDWLDSETDVIAPGPTKLWGAFNIFMADNYDSLKAKGYSKRDIDRLPVKQLMSSIQKWVNANPL